MAFLQSPYHIGSHGRMFDWVYRGSIRGFSSGGANHHDAWCGGCGTGIWYFFRNIWSHEFANDGNAVNTNGDLVPAGGYHSISGYSSETHSFVAGGRNSGNSADVNVIQSFPNVNPAAGATDLADLTSADASFTPVSGLTHGYCNGGRTGTHTTMEKFAFVNTTNATLVGNLANTHATSSGGGATDSANDYGYVAGGTNSGTDAIDRFSFANESNSDDVGNLATGSGQAAGCSAETHGYFLGPGNPTRVQKYAFASSGNATQVSTLSSSGTGRGEGMSSMTHGYVTGGEVHHTQIDKFSFANETTWNDVGDLGSGQTTNRCHHASSHF